MTITLYEIIEFISENNFISDSGFWIVNSFYLKDKFEVSYKPNRCEGEWSVVSIANAGDEVYRTSEVFYKNHVEFYDFCLNSSMDLDVFHCKLTGFIKMTAASADLFLDSITKKFGEQFVIDGKKELKQFTTSIVELVEKTIKKGNFSIVKNEE